MPSRRIAVFSDIHSNKLAMEAFLNDLRQLNSPVDAYWCLGDVVGRGPEPIPVLQSLKDLFEQQSPQDQANWLAGNHDLMVLGKIPRDKIFDSHLGGYAKDAVMMAEHNSNLLEEHAEGRELKTWLNRHNHNEPYTGVYLSHGGYIYDGDELDSKNLYDYYVSDSIHATRQLKDLQKYASNQPRLVLNGHTHQPLLVRLKHGERQGKNLYPNYQGEYLTDLTTHPICLNPGSIGFPRLLNEQQQRMPTYAVLNLEFDRNWQLEALAVDFREIPYDWQPYFSEKPRGLMLSHFYPDAYRNEVQAHTRPK